MTKVPAAFPVEDVGAAEEVELPDLEIGVVFVVMETSLEVVGAGVTIESVVVSVDSAESLVVFGLEEELEEAVSATVVVVAAILPFGPHPGI